MINVFKKPQTQIENKTFNKNSPIISDKQIKEEEINTEIKPEKTNLMTKFNETNNNEIFISKKKKRKEKTIEIEISDEEDMKINTEKELEKIELKDNIVIRLLEKDNIKYIDLCKFYKGYPTKKNFRIDYNLFKQINNYLNNIYK